MAERLRPGMSEMMHRVVQQSEQKQLWVEHDSPEIIAEMIAEETEELKQAIQESMLSGDVFNVASEIGDVLYLALKFCHAVGLSPDDVVQLKILRNDLKYPSDMNSHGDYETQRRRSKDMWTAMGGDEAFSHAYLEMFAEMEEEPITNPLAVAMGQNGNGHHNGHTVESIEKLQTIYSANGNG